MILKSEQKKLIKKIESGEITNLLTFFEQYYGDCLFGYDFDTIQKKKKADYDRNKEKIIHYITKQKTYGYKVTQIVGRMRGETLGQFNEKQLKACEERLRNYQIEKKQFVRPLGASSYSKVNLSKDKVYCIDDYSKAELFVSTINYLIHEEHIALDKVDSDESIKILFYKKMKNEKDNLQKNEISHFEKEIKSKKPADNEFELSNVQIYKKNDFLYSEDVICTNAELEKICRSCISCEIFVKESLRCFVKNGFITSEERRFRRQTTLTWIAIISSMILSVISIVFTSVTNRNNTNFWEDNEQDELIIMSDISESLESIDSSLNVIIANDNFDEDRIEELLIVIEKKLDDIGKEKNNDE